MKIKTLKRIYPFINTDAKNINWRTITKEELKKCILEEQKTCNCFHNATRVALFNSDKGQEILLDRVKVEKDSLPNSDPAYKIVLTPNKEKEIYRITVFDYLNKFFDVYKQYNTNPENVYDFVDSESQNLNTAFDIAVAKMIDKHPKQKPWYMRIYDWPNNKKYEYNKPSKAFEWLTGIKPIQYGEEGYKTELNKYKEEVLKLLKTLGNMSSKDYSFILMSGSKYTPNCEKWHCLPITKVDNNEERVWFINKRFNKTYSVSFATVINNFKAIVGINWNDLKK